jgi:hypothetical protein
LEKHLIKLGIQVKCLDSEEIRQDLCKDLDFSAKDRSESIRRVVAVAKILTGLGAATLVYMTFKNSILFVQEFVCPYPDYCGGYRTNKQRYIKNHLKRRMFGCRTNFECECCASID